jgi:L-ascorbate metabolism protein UlaG (beta-lactamase superfamily)
VKAKHNELEKYAPYMMPSSAATFAPDTVRVSFFGVSCLLFDDGKDRILVDGFFSRPGRADVILGKIAPNAALIHESLERAGIHRLNAVVVSHSHYDHALDSAEIAKQTGAFVVGSESTANIARGAGLPEDRIRIMHDGNKGEIGAFRVTFVHSEHAPSAAMMIAGGDITKALKTPTRAFHYQEGGTYSILITHGKQKFLVQSSAGFVPGALKGQPADVIFLGVGLLGRQNDKYREKFWQEVVRTVGAKRVIPVHWDDFMRPLKEPLVLAPRPFDEVEKAIDFVITDGKRDGVDVKFMPLWTPLDPTAGL